MLLQLTSLFFNIIIPAQGIHPPFFSKPSSKSELVHLITEKSSTVKPAAIGSFTVHIPTKINHRHQILHYHSHLNLSNCLRPPPNRWLRASSVTSEIQHYSTKLGLIPVVSEFSKRSYGHIVKDKFEMPFWCLFGAGWFSLDLNWKAWVNPGIFRKRPTEWAEQWEHFHSQEPHDIRGHQLVVWVY